MGSNWLIGVVNAFQDCSSAAVLLGLCDSAWGPNQRGGGGGHDDDDAPVAIIPCPVSPNPSGCCLLTPQSLLAGWWSIRLLIWSFSWGPRVAVPCPVCSCINTSRFLDRRTTSSSSSLLSLAVPCPILLASSSSSCCCCCGCVLW